MLDSRQFVPVSALVLAAAYLAACGSPDAQREETLAARGLVERHYALAIKGSAGAVSSAQVTLPSQTLSKSLTPFTADAQPPSISLEVDARMSKAVSDWIGKSMIDGYVTMSGEVHTCDSMFRSQSVSEFANAFISEVTFPPFAGDSKDAVTLIVKLTPQSIGTTKGSGQKLTIESPPVKSKWMASNYRFSLASLPTSHVVKVEGFTWKQELAKSKLGSTRTSVGTTTQISPPNLKVTIAMSDWKVWRDFADDYLVGGPQNYSGSLEFLSPDMTQTLGTVSISDVGIVKLVEVLEANKESLRTFTAELSVGRMTFSR